MFVDELSQRNAHLFFNDARVIDMSTYAEEFCSLISLSPEASKPARATPADRGGHSDGLHIRHCCWAPEKAYVGGKGGLETGFPLFPFYALNECSFLSTNVGSRSTMDVYVERVARPAGVLAEVASGVSLIDSLLDVRRFLVKLSSNVNVGSSRVHAASSYETALDEFVRISTEDFTIFASAGFTLIGVDNEVARPTVNIEYRIYGILEKKLTVGPSPNRACS